MRQISPNAKTLLLTVLTWKCASTNEAKLVPASVFCLSSSSLVAEVLTSRCIRAVCSRKPTRLRAAKLLQSCSTLCYPMDCSPPGSFVHGDSPGKNTGVGCHALLQGIFPTQGSNPGLPHCRWILYCLRHQVSSISCSNKLANPGRGSWEPLIYIWSVRITGSNLGLKGVWSGSSLVGLSS